MATNITDGTPESSRSITPPVEVPEILSSFEFIVKQQQQLQHYQKQLELQKQQLQMQQQQLDGLTNELSKIKNPVFEPKVAEQKRNSTSNFGLVLSKIKKRLSGVSESSKYQPRFALIQILFSYIGSFIGIAALAYLTADTKYHLIAAPFGAAAVLLFAAPDSPFAQPRNCIIGNFFGGVVSLVMVHSFGSEPWVMALAVATTIKVMQLTKTLHPPGGAVALVGVMSNAEWSFLLTPVFAGSVILVLCTVAFNNLMPGRSYPKHWF